MRLIGPSTILDPIDSNYMAMVLVERSEVGVGDLCKQQTGNKSNDNVECELNTSEIHCRRAGGQSSGCGKPGNPVMRTLIWVSIAIAGISRGLQPKQIN